MSRIAQLEALVAELYEQKHEGRADWADWMYEHHVFVVADYATKLAKKYDANGEYARAAALLHDIADVVIARSDPSHETRSIEIARSLLAQCEYSQGEIALIVDDAIMFHSCHDGNAPSSVEGKVLATADSFAHLKTDFYVYAVSAFAGSKSLADIKQWVLKKIERDLNNKVFFDDEREELLPDYTMIKELFSR